LIEMRGLQTSIGAHAGASARRGGRISRMPRLRKSIEFFCEAEAKILRDNALATRAVRR
jgi:hypothetical protein